MEHSRTRFGSIQIIDKVPARKLPVLVILLFTISALLPVLRNGFVDWDNSSLFNNPESLTWKHWLWLFTDFRSALYQPLSRITLGVDYLFWWSDPFGYHLTNLLLHAGSSVFFYFVALRLLILGGSSKSLTMPGLRIGASIAALFFAIHPLRVEPVAWASARGEVLGGLFSIFSVSCYLRAFAARGDRLWIFWMAVSVCAYGLSLLSSPIGFALPAVLLILDIYGLGRFDGSENWLGSQARRLYREKTPYLCLSGPAVLIAIVAKHHDPAASNIDRDPVSTWIMNLMAAPAFYLWKTIVPIQLSPLYQLNFWSVTAAALATLGISVAIFLMRKRSPILLPVWICYLALALGVTSFALGAGEPMADRYTYLCSLPCALLLAIVVARCWAIWGSPRGGRWPWFVSGGATALLLFTVGALSWRQAGVWRDSETLWRHAAAASDSSQAHFNLAGILENQGKHEDAIRSYKKAMEADPRRWDVHEKAALLLRQQGKHPEAIEHLWRVVEINPAAAEARNNLAAGLASQGKMAEAAQQLRKVLELAPERNEARIRLGAILALQGRLGDATELFQQVVKSEPENAKALLNLGQLLAAQGDSEQAVRYFREALRVRPGDALIHENLGRALAQQGKMDEAAKHLQEAVRILKSIPVAR